MFNTESHLTTREVNQAIATSINKIGTKNAIKQHLGRYEQKQISTSTLDTDEITAVALDFFGSGIALLQVITGMHVPHIERLCRIRYICLITS